MGQAAETTWQADDFLLADQRAFGDAWRDELVDGVVVAHAAPSPEHGAILALLNAALVTRLRGQRDGCRAETGSGAAPARQQRDTGRISDAMIRCGNNPRVVFEVVSPSELRAWRSQDRKRIDEQHVEGVEEIVELYQGDPAAHVYRRAPGGTWSFEAVGGLDAVLTLRSVGIEIPLHEVYETVDLAAEGEQPET